MPRKRKEDIEREMSEGKLHKPQQRNAANARERSRMRVLSKAFSRLKTTLPWVPPDTKLSKLDTLRLASSYIAHLKQILDHEEAAHNAAYIHPLNLTWPFTFNGRAFGASPTSSSSSEMSSNNNNNNNNSSSTGNNNNNNSNINKVHKSHSNKSSCIMAANSDSHSSSGSSSSGERSPEITDRHGFSEHVFVAH